MKNMSVSPFFSKECMIFFFWVYYNRTVYALCKLGEQSLNLDDSKSKTVSLELNTSTEQEICASILPPKFILIIICVGCNKKGEEHQKKGKRGAQ